MLGRSIKTAILNDEEGDCVNINTFPATFMLIDYPPREKFNLLRGTLISDTTCCPR